MNEKEAKENLRENVGGRLAFWSRGYLEAIEKFKELKNLVQEKCPCNCSDDGYVCRKHVVLSRWEEGE